MSSPAGGEHTQRIEHWIERLAAGDAAARDQLIQAACDRLMQLTRSMKQHFGSVGRWEQTEDVFQRAMIRLYGALDEVQVNDVRHFFRLAALQIRRELVDLARHYSGPMGMGAHHATQVSPAPQSNAPHAANDAAALTDNPAGLAQWGEFHEAIGSLPDHEREVVELLFYHGLSQEEAANIMGVSVRTIKRYWRDARLALHEQLEGGLPGM